MLSGKTVRTMTRGSFVLRAGLLAALPLATCLCGVALATPSQPAAGTDENERVTAIEVSLEPATWTEGLDCAACHKKEAAAVEGLKDPGSTENGDAPTSLVEAHAALDFACSTCHYDTETLSALHESPNPKKKVRRLKQTEVAKELCLSCHDAAALTEATQDLGLLVDKEGLEVNPHDLPDVEGHAGLSCTSCHVAHETLALRDEAVETCTNCHHANVFACGTCHQ